MTQAYLNGLSLLPPLVTIALAFVTKRVLPSLGIGVLVSHVLLAWPRPWLAPANAIGQLLDVATDRGNLVLIVFSLAVGGLLQLIRAGRGFDGFTQMLDQGRGRLSRRTAFGLTWAIGAGMFLDGWSNVLVNGATSGALYDRLHMSRLRMAYFIHTIGICVVAMATINGWGAFYMGLLRAQHVERPLSFVLSSVPFMVYGWASLAFVVVVMATGLTIGPMRRFEGVAGGGRSTPADESPATGDASPEVPPRASILVLPLVTLFLVVFAALYATGGGNLLVGDGGLSILYGVLAASLVAAGLLLRHGVLGAMAVEEQFVAGMARFFDVGLLVVLALALGDLTRQLGTGSFMATMATGALPAFTLPALVFVLGAVMAFATGTSWGTYSIMLPIALQLGHAVGLDPRLMFGACISGGLWGDNCSPISDTTIMTTIGAEVAIVDHVATQLPYALISGAVTLAIFLVLGILF